MPGRRRAPVKRPRTRKNVRRNKPLLLILGIEEPLTDAINYVQALYLMGFGLISHHEAGGDALAPGLFGNAIDGIGAAGFAGTHQSVQRNAEDIITTPPIITATSRIAV